MGEAAGPAAVALQCASSTGWEGVEERVGQQGLLCNGWEGLIQERVLWGDAQHGVAAVPAHALGHCAAAGRPAGGQALLSTHHDNCSSSSSVEWVVRAERGVRSMQPASMRECWHMCGAVWLTIGMEQGCLGADGSGNIDGYCRLVPVVTIGEDPDDVQLVLVVLEQSAILLPYLSLSLHPSLDMSLHSCLGSWNSDQHCCQYL